MRAQFYETRLGENLIYAKKLGAVALEAAHRDTWTPNSFQLLTHRKGGSLGVASSDYENKKDVSDE
jgi:hypothetical protein